MQFSRLDQNVRDGIAMSEYDRHASLKDIRNEFTKHHDELLALALFLTGDEGRAETCFTAARALARAYKNVSLPYVIYWLRRATILSAVQLQQLRITQLADMYTARLCPHGVHPVLSPEEVDSLRAQRRACALQLDTLCRFALVMYGIEKYSPAQAALLLGVSKKAFDAAYCATVESLKANIATPSRKQQSQAPELPLIFGQERKRNVSGPYQVSH
jgi:DNA-directed RNA polymerase specialized sigma24 family protein